MYRNELKFLITLEQKHQLLQRLLDVAIIDPHYLPKGRVVSSLYFDSPLLNAFHEKIDGLPIRWKARARRYLPCDATPPIEKLPVFLEIKHRFDQLNQKEREVISSQLFLKELEQLHLNNNQGSFFFRACYLNQLKPKATICYRREAFFLSQNPSVRITFDHNLMVAHPDFWLYQKGCLHPFLSSHLVVLEIKANGKAPGWLEQLCHRLELHSRSFSKYAIGLSQLSRNGCFA